MRIEHRRGRIVGQLFSLSRDEQAFEDLHLDAALGQHGEVGELEGCIGKQRMHKNVVFEGRHLFQVEMVVDQQAGEDSDFSFRSLRFQIFEFAADCSSLGLLSKDFSNRVVIQILGLRQIPRALAKQVTPDFEFNLEGFLPVDARVGECGLIYVLMQDGELRVI